MAAVYLAVQESLGRRVALKVLQTSDTPEQSERFINEGRIIASLAHPNIITIHDVGAIDGHYFIAMEYLEGGDLEARIHSGVPPSSAIALLKTMGECLAFVHTKGIVHRDIKPANILFRGDDSPVVTDFGIAKHLEQDTKLTRDGTAMGSPDYLSPEQAECKPLDGRTDVYGLGIVFYEMLTGQTPYHRDSYIETVMAHLTEPIPALPTELACYQTLLDRMIAKNRDERFGHAAQLVDYINQLLASGVIATGTDGRPQQTAPTVALSDLAIGPTSRSPDNTKSGRWLAPLKRSLGGRVVAFRRLFPRGPRLSGFSTPQSAVGVTAMMLLLGGIIVYVSGGSSRSSGELAAGGFSVSHQPDADLSLRKNTLDELSQNPTENPNQVTAATDRPLNPPDLIAQGSSTQPTDNPEPLLPVTPMDVTQQRRIGELIALAQRALEEYRLTTPAGKNAYDHYQEALKLDSGNQDVAKGLQEIATRYAWLAKAQIARHRYETALQYVDLGLSVQPDHQKLVDLKARFNNGEFNDVHWTTNARRKTEAWGREAKQGLSTLWGNITQ